MTLRRGTSLLDLLPQTTELAGVLPDDIVDRVGVLTVLDHRSMESEGVVFHRGTLQDPTDVLGVDTSQWVLNIPGVSTGLPFRLAVRRGQAGTGGNQEAGSTGWVLDILVEDAELRISQLRPAVLAGGQGTNPLHLEPSPGGGDVVLAFSGVVRVSGGGADGTKIEVVDDPDPFDPDAPAGAVIRLTARPPSFLFGSTQYGATLENLLVDLSRNFTPGDVMARGHGEDFEGLAYKSLSFYLPKSTPIVGSLSISTKDVIFGWSPLGVQGELALEFGKQFQNLVLGGVTFIPTGDPSHPLTVTNQGQNTTNLDVQLPSSATATTPASVDVQFSVPTNTIDGRKPTSVSWALSDGREGALLDLPGTITLSVRVNDVLKFRIEVTPTDPSDDTGPSKLAEVAVRFVAATGGPNSTPASKINVVLGNQTFKNATKVRGNPTALAGIRFETDPTDTKALWSVGAGVIKDASTERNAVFTPQLLPDPDGHPVKLQLQSNNHTRYLELEIKRNQAVLIGHRTDDGQGKVTRVPAGNITVDSPPKPTTYALAAFHATGDHGTTQQKAANPEVTITPGSTSFAVPPGILADVQVSGDTTTTGTPSASRDSTGAVKRGFAVFFSFAQSDPPIGAAPIDENATASNLDPDTHDQLARPLVAAQAGPDYNAIVSEALTKWLAQFPDPLPSGFQFLVVGRTDDLWLNAQTILDNASQNDGLAGERAQTVVDLLPSKVRPNALQATEQGSKAGFPSGAPTRIAFTGRLAVPSATLFSASAPFSKKGWSADGPSSSPQHATAVADAHRPPYRCVEIYAFDPNGTTPTPPSPTAPAVARMLVPGDDGDAATPPGTTTDQSPPTNYRLRLRAKWDSPTVVQAADAVPTLAEAIVDLAAGQVTLPGTSETATPVNPPANSVWEILLRWAHDERTGATEVTGSLTLPQGTMEYHSDLLAGALAFAPPLGALVDATGLATDNTGLNFLKAGALLAAGGVVEKFVLSDPDEPSTVEIQRFEIKYRWDSESFLQATVDYICKLGADVELLGLHGKSFKIRYKNIGVRFETGGALGLDGISLVYDRMSVEVQDYGTWQINGALGELLRVASARLGSGSVWMELKLEIAADLGVIRLEDATVRVTVAPTFGAELRGLTATVDIDGVLEGEGSVSVGDHGDIRALLALDIIPAKVSAYGALALNPPFADIEVGVQFPVGIPLASTGLAVFGFNGRFVANGKRDLSSVNNPDPVQRELDWFANVPPQNKYTLQRGQYAIGFGTVIGTLPDAGFSLNAAGSLCVEFPDIAVILGVSAQVLTGHGDAEEQGSSGGGALSIIGLTVIDETGITIGLRGTYDIPKVLHLVVPVSARFPFSGGDPWFIRIGTDNVPAPPYGPSRAGSPVTLTLFPDTLNVKATGFLMFEEAGIGHLGNDPSLNLYGFSIGFGAGFSVDFGAGPFRLTGSARMLVGIGTRPLMLAGAIQISGSLSLVVVSLSLSGTLNFRILDGHAFFEGHFCAGIDCWFFSISGCVDITFVDDIPDTVPPPQSPIGSIDLCDHRSAVKRTLTATATPGTPLPVVWPDTLPVIHFQHGMQDGVIGVGAAAFNIAVSEPSIPTWSGTNALKYAFRLESVDIFKLAAGGNPTDDTAWTRLTGRFDAAWWFPSGRAAIITTGTADAPASAEEGRDLGLFWWHPSPWARWLDQSGGAGLPGDPAKPWSQTCTPTPPVTPACAFGSDASSIAIARTTITSRPQVGVAFPSQFNVALGLDPTISPTLLFALATQVGYAITPPGVVSLSRSTVSDGVTATQALRLPSFGRQGRFLLSLPVDAALTPSLVSPVVTLEFCPDPQRDPTPVDLGIGGGTSTTCEIFDELEASRVARGLPTDAGTLIVPELASEAIGSFSDGGTLGLVVPANGMHADLPGQFKEVTVSGFAGAGLTVQGLDVSGNVVASGIMQGPGPRSVDLGATAIVRVRMIPFSAPGGGGTGGGGAGGGGTGGGGTGGGGTGGGGTGGGGTGGGGTGGGAGGGNGLSGSSPGDVGCANSTCFCSTSSTTGGAGRTGGTAGGPGTSGGPDGPSGPGLTGSPDNPGNGPIGPGTGPTGEPGSGDPGGLGQPPTDTGGNAGPARIVEICRVTSGLGVPVDPGSFVPPAGALPTVVGVLPTGDEVVFPATVIDVPPGAPPPCQHVSYQAPDNTTVWTLIRVKPFALGPIKIISICGVTTEALAAQAADQQLRNTLVSAGNNFAVPATGGTPTRHVALAPASTYQIRVRWTYQGWKAEHTGDSPPSLSNKWLDGTTERFTFSTADWGTVANPGGAAGLGPSPADGGPGFDESTFDAHGISRFVTYSQPADLAPDPFFVGDPLLFGFMVDHILELLGKYNATLTVQVLRTDPPLGALNGAPPHAPGTPNRLDVATGTTISRDPTTYFPAETRIASITSNPVTSPCMGVTPGFGASVAQVAANLDPDASYDLHLLAVRNSNEEVTIARAQFRTSHYRDVPALVSALGFGVTKPGLSAPRDFILTSAAPPLGDGGNSDGAMDAALAALGMDPWPLAASPEATLIWQAPSDPVSPWALVAILFEAEEPLERAPLPSDAIGNTNPLPRMTLSHLDVVQLDANNQPVGTSTLTAKIRNASGTRVLLFPATPLALVAGANYRLTLSVAEPKGVVTRGSAPLYDRPLTVILEGS